MEKKPLTVENLVDGGISKEGAEKIVKIAESIASDPDFFKKYGTVKGDTDEENNKKSDL